MYGFYNEKINFIFEYNDPPRSSGISRLALFLLIFFEFSSFLAKKKIKYILISILLIPIIILTQSRINTSLFLILFIYLFIFTRNKKFFFINYILIPLLFIVIINIFKPSNNNIFFNPTNEISTSLSKIVEKNIRQTDKDSFSSKRFEGWLYILELKRKNLITELDTIVGFGPQGDRLFVKTSISNALLYALLSCGFIGAIILLLIYLNLIAILYEKIKNIRLLFLENEYIKISFFLIVFVFLRSFLENSFSIFGIDFIFLLIAIQVFKNEKNKS